MLAAMRHEKTARVLELARLMAGSAEGLTLDEMARGLKVGRRTAERMRDAAATLFPQMEAVEDPPTRRFRIPGGLDGLFQSPTADELAALRRAADALDREGAAASAMALRSLEQKVLAAMRRPARSRLAPDLELRVQSQAVSIQAGPRPFEEEAVLDLVHQAIAAGRMLSFRYGGGAAPGRVREVAPLGLLFGRSNYLVAAEADGAPKSWRLDRMSEVKGLDRPAAAPEGFSLQAYADESFGIYHDAVEDVVLRFAPEAAASALRWRFHGSQAVRVEADGSVEVAFRASGMRELAWHLFTWGAAVQIVQPERLRVLLVEALRTALAAHADRRGRGAWERGGSYAPRRR